MNMNHLPAWFIIINIKTWVHICRTKCRSDAPFVWVLNERKEKCRHKLNTRNARLHYKWREEEARKKQTVRRDCAVAQETHRLKWTPGQAQPGPNCSNNRVRGSRTVVMHNLSNNTIKYSSCCWCRHRGAFSCLPRLDFPSNFTRKLCQRTLHILLYDRYVRLEL